MFQTLTVACRASSAFQTVKTKHFKTILTQRGTQTFEFWDRKEKESIYIKTSLNKNIKYFKILVRIKQIRIITLIYQVTNYLSKTNTILTSSKKYHSLNFKITEQYIKAINIHILSINSHNLSLNSSMIPPNNIISRSQVFKE